MLLAQNVERELRRSVVLVLELLALGQSDAVEVLLKQARAVLRAALGLGVELSREDGSGLVDHALVASVVEVDKVLLEAAGQGAGINGVTVVLAGISARRH